MFKVFLACCGLLFALAPVVHAQASPSDCVPNHSLEDQYVEITPSNFGHLERVVSFDCVTPVELQWSPNGQYLAVSTPETLALFDMYSENEPLSFPPTAFSPFEPGAFRFSSDSTRLATVDPETGNLHLWSLMDTQGPTVIEAQVEMSDDSYEYSGFAAISPDLSTWALSYGGGTIYLLDATTGDQLATLHGHFQVGALMFTPDGTRLISGGRERGAELYPEESSVNVWDVETGNLLAGFDVGSPLNFTANSPQFIAISSDGNFAAFTTLTDRSGASEIGFIDLSTLSYTSFVVENHGVKSVAFTQEGSELIASTYDQQGTYDYSVSMLDVESKRILDQLEVDNFVLDFSLHPDGTLLAIAHNASSGEKVGVWASMD